MMFTELYYLIPFWAIVLILLRFITPTYSLLLLAFLIVGVELLRAKKIDDFTWSEMIKDINIIGHKGCANNAPENTLAGVRKAHELGVKGIEFDIMLTLDNVPIAFHDSTADRTTDKTGEIGMMRWEEVKKLDASYRYTGEGSYSNERVPHMKEMLREIKKYGMVAFLDMKGSQPMEMAKVMKDMVQEFPDLHKWAIVCSFYPQTLAAVKWELPQFATILTHRPWVLTLKNPDGPARNDETWKKIVAPVADVILDMTIYHFWWYFCGANGFFMQEQVISVQEQKYWKTRGLDVFVWTVNDLDRKSYLRSLNVPYITDDCHV